MTEFYQINRPTWLSPTGQVHCRLRHKRLKNHNLLKRAGFDIENELNLMPLPTKKGVAVKYDIDPGASLHRGRHTDAAIKRLKETMDKVVKQGEVEGWTKQEYLKAVNRIIEEEKVGLGLGKLKLNNAK